MSIGGYPVSYRRQAERYRPSGGLSKPDVVITKVPPPANDNHWLPPKPANDNHPPISRPPRIGPKSGLSPGRAYWLSGLAVAIGETIGMHIAYWRAGWGKVDLSGYTKVADCTGSDGQIWSAGQGFSTCGLYAEPAGSPMKAPYDSWPQIGPNVGRPTALWTWTYVFSDSLGRHWYQSNSAYNRTGATIIPLQRHSILPKEPLFPEKMPWAAIPYAVPTATHEFGYDLPAASPVPVPEPFPSWSWSPDMQGFPRPGTGGRHAYAQPPAGDREKKGRIRQSLAQLLPVLWAITEMKDFEDAAVKAFPAADQKAMAKMTVQGKAVYMGQHLDRLDLNQFVLNLIANHFIDKLAAKGFQRVRRQLARAGFHLESPGQIPSIRL